MAAAQDGPRCCLETHYEMCHRCDDCGRLVCYYCIRDGCKSGRQGGLSCRQCSLSCVHFEKNPDPLIGVSSKAMHVSLHFTPRTYTSPRAGYICGSIDDADLWYMTELRPILPGPGILEYKEEDLDMLPPWRLFDLTPRMIAQNLYVERTWFLEKQEPRESRYSFNACFPSTVGPRFEHLDSPGVVALKPDLWYINPELVDAMNHKCQKLAAAIRCGEHLEFKIVEFEDMPYDAEAPWIEEPDSGSDSEMPELDVVSSSLGCKK